MKTTPSSKNQIIKNIEKKYKEFLEKLALAKEKLDQLIQDYQKEIKEEKIKELRENFKQYERDDK